jgi:hypothetical protein
MVWIPGGTFLMGSDKHYQEEAPAHHAFNPKGTFRWVSRSILPLLVTTLFVTTAMSGESPKPSGKVSMQSKSIAAGIGVTWGDGKLSFKGNDYPFSIDGLTVVDMGITKASATGDV